MCCARATPSSFGSSTVCAVAEATNRDGGRPAGSQYRVRVTYRASRQDNAGRATRLSRLRGYRGIREGADPGADCDRISGSVTPGKKGRAPASINGGRRCRRASADESRRILSTRDYPADGCFSRHTISVCRQAQRVSIYGYLLSIYIKFHMYETLSVYISGDAHVHSFGRGQLVSLPALFAEEFLRCRLAG
jgi:hypothetical protein